MFDGWTLTLKNLLLPMSCKCCGLRLLTEENRFFCPTCWEVSPRIERPFCTICGQPHAGAAGFNRDRNFPCAKCRSGRPKPYRRVYGAALFAGAIEEAVKLLKFHDRPSLAIPLAAEMAAFAEREMDCAGYDFLVPVPLHRVRERARGFNQSRLLAQALADAFPAARLDESLQRIRPTRVQSRLTKPAERLSNMRGAFAVMGETALKGATVLLIDDVVTTTGTVAECARALKRAGIDTVDVLAVALAPGIPQRQEVQNRVAGAQRGQQ